MPMRGADRSFLNERGIQHGKMDQCGQLVRNWPFDCVARKFPDQTMLSQEHTAGGHAMLLPLNDKYCKHCSSTSAIRAIWWGKGK